MQAINMIFWIFPSGFVIHPLNITLNSKINRYIQFINMQHQVIDSNFLPKRNSRSLGAFKNCQPKSFVTNFYDVRLHPSLNKIYVYQAKFPSDIPSDSSQIFARCLYQLRSDLKQNIGFVCFSGKVVYGTKENKISLTFQSKIAGNTIQVQLKLTKELNVVTLLQDPKTRPMIFQFLNSKLKSCLRHANICELGKAGQFYQKDQLLRGFKKEMQNQYFNLQRAGLNVLRGYKFTLLMIKSKLKLQLDVCSRVLQRNNLQEDFLEFPGTTEELEQAYKGVTVITRYGNYRTYKIQQIDFHLSPSSTFEFKGQKISFQQYYKKAYNADIYDLKQPLLKVLAQVKKQINKKQAIQRQPEYIYLVPELVSLTGMKDEQRMNFQSMRALAPFTKLDPNTRFEESFKILGTLNEAKDILQIGQEQYMKGQQLPDPVIRFRQIANLKFGSISNRGELFKAHTFVNWMFVYTKGVQQDYNQAVEIENFLKQASNTYGIFYEEPIYVEINCQQLQVKLSAEHFCQKISQNLPQERKLELIFIILKPKQAIFYGKIKDYITNILDIPCQVVQSKSFSKEKGVLSVASKIAIQMSCKAGDAPWKVQNTISYFKERNYAYCAISSSAKGKGGFTLSFIGTTNNSCTQVYSNYMLKIPKKEKIDGIILKIWFVNWIKKYYMKNKKLPDTLLLYRQSVGDSLIKPVLHHEIDILKSSIDDVKKKAKAPNYNPEIIYIIVNKRINSRFFSLTDSRLFNPEPGSVVVEEMSIDDRFDFHLVAQKVTQGTSTPSHYIVAYDSSKIPQEDLIRFTYEQCYNYYNWQGSVKVPAALQCATKLSRLAGESIKAEFKEKKETKVNETFFFL